MRSISIQQTLKDKSILITGTTGFVGGVLLSLTLHDFPDIRKIVIIVRGNKEKNSNERFHEMLKTDCFLRLREKWGARWLDQIQKKVEVLEGDVSLPHFGLSQKDTARLQRELDLIIHAAGCVSLIAPMKTYIEANIVGASHIADFIKNSDHAKLLHISTCYIVGAQDGVFKEISYKNLSPTQQTYNRDELLQEDYEKIEEIENTPHLDLKQINKRLTEFGLEKAKKWGWPNAYVYSKAISEAILETTCRPEQLTIFRPSIVESAIEYPVPGWNQGFNTTSPLIYIMGTWYPFLIAKKDYVLDIVPVDMTCKAVLIAAVALLNNVHFSHYHFSSSHEHPLAVGDAARYSREAHRNYLKVHGKRWWDKHLRAFSDLILISPTHALSPPNLYHATNLLCEFTSKIFNLTPFSAAAQNKLMHFNKSIRRWSFVHEIYIPYIHSYNTIFEAKNIKEHPIFEPEYQVNLHVVDWENYFKEVHIPGLRRYSFPKYEKLL